MADDNAVVKAMAEAKAFGDVALMAEGYAGKSARYLGVYELQEEVVQERPTYKQQRGESFLFYTADDKWVVGPDSSDTLGEWEVASVATMPGAITQAWTAWDGEDMAEVGAARIVGRAAFETAVVEQAAVCDAEQATLREAARAEADWRADQEAAVAARKAAAPLEVRTVLGGGLVDVYGTREHERVARVVAEWLVGAHAAAHDDPATKRLARLVLGVDAFATNMSACDVFYDPYKSGLRQRLQALGAPLAEAFVRDGLRVMLGDITMAEHKFVAAARTHCAKAGTKFVLRSDMPGIVPLPVAVAQSVGSQGAAAVGEPPRDAVARQTHERVFTHMLKMIAMALNAEFHAMMRETLAAHTVAGKGLMQQKGGTWYMCPEKGVARMECKRVTDHAAEAGCRPACNIDVLRVLGVCRGPRELLAAMAALEARFGGCGRVKVGFAMADAKAAQGFHLRVMMGNFVVDFGCAYAELAARPGVAEMWAAHVASAPEGGAPRGPWRAEAEMARTMLTSDELAHLPVRFIGEAQMMLEETHDVRARMHELYKGYRADSDEQLHADMVGETRKVARAAQVAADADTPLKAAVSRGDNGATVARLFAAAAPAERSAAFVVACALGHDAALAAMAVAAAGSSGLDVAAVWGEAWRRAAAEDAPAEMSVGAVEALLSGMGRLAGGVDEELGGERMTALKVAARGGHDLAVGRLLAAGAAVDATGGGDYTALLLAARNGHVAVVQRLIAAGAAVDRADGTGATPLFIAAQEGRDGVVGMLLAAGAAANEAEEDGTAPLYIAAKYGHEAVVQQLLAAGAFVDRATDTGATPLYIAAENGHGAVVQQLLAAGAAVNQATENEVTPLFMAAQEGHEAVVQQLLAAGAAVDQARADGDTPLSIAAFKGVVATMELLVAAGANVHHMGEFGSALLGAEEQGHAAAAALLRAAGATS